MTISKARSILLAACLLLFPLVASAQILDSDKPWTTAGSTGTLDEKSEGKVFFDRAVVQKGQALVIGPAAREVRSEGEADVLDSAVIRYNVTAVDGVMGGDSIGMAIRFRDEGKSARVVADLIEVNLATGTEVTLLTFDSNDPSVPVLGGYHVHDVFACNIRKQPFDFTKNAYYIEVTLTTSLIAESSAAGVEIIQLHGTTCTRF